MDFLTTESSWEFTTTLYYLNCTKGGTSPLNITITTPFDSFETTTSDTLSTLTMSEMFKILIMISSIFGMVVVIMLYAAVYRMCCSGDQSYHDSCKEGTLHVGMTLLTYVLYLFDTFSDVFLFVHYISIGETSKFLLVMGFTFAPILFLAFVFFAEKHEKWFCTYTDLSCTKQLAFQLFGLALILIFSPFAALLPTYIYAQLLARGKENIRWQFLTAYLILIEATLESAPQLTVQIYLAITDTYIDTPFTIMIRYLSIAASTIGLAWSLNAFKHHVREEEDQREDSLKVKLVHWVTRFAEIVPRILLIALITAEYSVFVVMFILYRIVFGSIYGGCDIRLDGKNCRFLEEPDLFIGIVGNIFCFSMTHIYTCHKKEHFGGKFFIGYYILYYAENMCMLYLWYSDDPALLKIKIGGACSNHEWFVPIVFVVVIGGFICQPPFLYLYYWLRRKQHEGECKQYTDTNHI